MPPKSLRKSKVRWFSDKPKRRKRGRRGSPRQLVALRMPELARLFRTRFGIHLPDDDAGRDDAFVAANHLAGLKEPRPRIMRWLDLWAPWMPVAEREDLATRAIADRQVWTADALAWRLGVTAAERKALALTTIGAIDETSAERLERRQTSNKVRLADLRREQGRKTRQEYLSEVAAKRPWEAAGISRATWFRRRKSETETG